MSSTLFLIDGTYELFRAYYTPGAHSRATKAGNTKTFAAVGLLRSLAKLLGDNKESSFGIAIAFDHVIESFRNDLFDDYKTGQEIEPDLLAQFELAEEAAAALGITIWPMIEFEADDALATAANLFTADYQRIVLSSPDKDLYQCVTDQVISWDRSRQIFRGPADVQQKLGIRPDQIADYLALVGDTADGIPGVPKWGAKSSATVLGHFGHIESIPDNESEWYFTLRGKAHLIESLRNHRSKVALFKQLATLRQDVPIKESAIDLLWNGLSKTTVDNFCKQIGEQKLSSFIVNKLG